MAIYGLTQDDNGNAIQQLAISTKVSIGLPPSDGKNYPSKLDHFFFATKNAKGEWVEDKPLTELLEKAYGTKPVRSFDVVFLSNDIDEVFRTELAWWSASERKCHGDGKTALRNIAIVPDELKKKYPNEKQVPWQGCGFNCPDLVAKRCKPSGVLAFMLPDRPVIGSVAVYYTTSYKSIRQIQSSLIHIMSLTGGRLRGIRLKMVLKPGATRYQDADGKTKKSNAFFVHIEFRREDEEKLLPELMAESAKFENVTRTGMKMIGAGTTARTQLVEALPEEEEAAIVGPEFYPDETDDEPEPEVDEALMARLADAGKKLGLNQAQQDGLMAHFGGDIDKVIGYLDELNAAFVSTKANQATIAQSIANGLSRPDALLKAAKLVKTEPKGGGAQPEKAAPKQEKKEEPVGAAAGDAEPWSF